jgi:hypothetical protein
MPTSIALVKLSALLKNGVDLVWKISNYAIAANKCDKNSPNGIAKNFAALGIRLMILPQV